jgi:hypothetical protein
MIEFSQGYLNVIVLLLQSMATLLDTVDKVTQLTGLARGRIVHLDNVADLTELREKPSRLPRRMSFSRTRSPGE